MPERTVEERVLERLRRLVEMESPSGDVARARALAEEIAAELRDTGAGATLVDAPGYGAHVRGRVEGTDASLAPILFMGHLDTVWPVGTLAERPFRVRDGRAEGPGTYDMKGGVSVLLEALSELHAQGERPRRPVEVLITCDEEVGSTTSRALIEELGRGAAAVLVLEPSLPGGLAKTGRKGVATYTVRITGRSAHAGGAPEQGVSAVTELAHQILRVLALAAPEKGTTVNVAPVRGGTVSNVVAAEAYMEVDIRIAVLEEGERVNAAMHALEPVLPGARLEVTGGVNRPPLERTAGVAALYGQARDAAAGIGFALGEGSTGGASDGCFTGALGIATLDGLGPDGAGAHAIDEHVLVADLPRRVALLRRLMETL